LCDASKHALPASTISRGLGDVIFFSFKDIHGNTFSVPLSQLQLDSYHHALGEFRSGA
jgi:hypothetical protein